MILFFVLTGASLELDSLASVGTLALAFIVLRALARAVGAIPGAYLAKAPQSIKHWIGLGLLPQAGVAVGMALIAAKEFPDIAETVIQVVVVATIVFEIIGPLVTRYCLEQVGDAHNGKAPAVK